MAFDGRADYFSIDELMRMAKEYGMDKTAEGRRMLEDFIASRKQYFNDDASAVLDNGDVMSAEELDKGYGLYKHDDGRHFTKVDERASTQKRDMDSVYENMADTHGDYDDIHEQQQRAKDSSYDIERRDEERLKEAERRQRANAEYERYGARSPRAEAKDFNELRGIKSNRFGGRNFKTFQPQYAFATDDLGVADSWSRVAHDAPMAARDYYFDLSPRERMSLAGASKAGRLTNNYDLADFGIGVGPDQPWKQWDQDYLDYALSTNPQDYEDLHRGFRPEELQRAKAVERQYKDKISQRWNDVFAEETMHPDAYEAKQYFRKNGEYPVRPEDVTTTGNWNFGGKKYDTTFAKNYGKTGNYDFYNKPNYNGPLRRIRENPRFLRGAKYSAAGGAAMLGGKALYDYYNKK